MIADIGFVRKLRESFSNLFIETDTPLETYLKEQYGTTRDIAYEQKRSIKGVSYAVSLNELITPNSFAVKKFMKNAAVTGKVAMDAMTQGTRIAKYLTWTDDKNLDKSGDYYLYPNESLAVKNCDCEDHAFVTSSCLPEVGVAYGFLGNGGHAFNVFLADGKLYVLDTTADTAIIKEYKGPDLNGYRIHYIITPRYTFQLIGGTKFGVIAGW